jgi:predicted nuclease with TOPRIM domain
LEHSSEQETNKEAYLGKVKNKTHSEVEELRGVVKKLKKENSQLKRQLRSANKYQHQYEDVIENNILEENPEEIVEKIAYCPECHKGRLKLVLSLDIRQVYECDQCDFRKTVKV